MEGGQPARPDASRGHGRSHGRRATGATATNRKVPMSTTIPHRILFIGGGSAGISVAARLRRAGVEDVGLLEPSAKHYYQPLWTLVGGGRAPAEESVRPEAAEIGRAHV